MNEPTTITGEQLEQAIAAIVTAVDWSDPPKSDTVAPGQRRRVNDNALQILVACARQSMKPATEPVPEMVLPDELVDVSSNGDQ